MAKILVVSKYYYPFPGGIEECARHNAEYAAKFHDVTVLASNHHAGNLTEKINGVTVRRRNVPLHVKGQPVSPAFFAGIRLGEYDLVHVHSPNPYAAAVLLGLRAISHDVPIVVTHHMDIFGRKLLRGLCLPFVRGLIRNAVVTIVTSQKNLAHSRDLPGDAAYEIVPLSVAPEAYAIDGELHAEACRWRHSLAGDAPVVGFVGRHARYKGLPVLMQALARLPGVHALIGGDGPCRSSAEETARRLGLSGRVHFLGHLDHREKLRLFAALDVFAFPSTEPTEAFGIAQMEAMLCRVPVVASDLPTGVTDVSIDGRTALLAPPGDALMLAAQIARLIADKPFARQLAETARAHVLTHMTHDTVSRRTLAIYEQAMARQFAGAEATLA